MSEETLARPEVELACELAVRQALAAVDQSLHKFARSALVGLLVSRPHGGDNGLANMMMNGVDQKLPQLFDAELGRSPTWGEHLATEAWAIARSMKAMEPKA